MKVLRERVIAAALGCLTAVTAAAQQDGTEPLSAIDWLSQSVQAPEAVAAEGVALDEPPVATSADTPEIIVTPLDRTSPDATGILSPAQTGLPRSLWASSGEAVLVPLVQAERVDTLPALQDLLVTLMLAEADPPAGAGAQGALFLARVDKLLDLGALDPAQALLEAAGPDSPDLFRRWFDVTLLTGTEDSACDVLRDKPTIAPTYPARIFCLARNGDWTAAALTLNTARALGDVTAEEDALLSRFLDPDLFEGLPPLPPPTRTSPLEFRMREAIGEGLTTATLPRAFSHADLRNTLGWRSRMEAAERLARFGAIPVNTLFDIYLLNTPAASGGVWDRAEAIQRFDTAVRAGDPTAVASALPGAYAAMQAIRAEVAFARFYAPGISRLPLSGPADALAYRIGLLSPEYETVALARAPVTPEERILQAIARGEVEGLASENRRITAVLTAFGTPPLAEPMATQIAEGKLGEAILRTVALFNQGLGGDLAAVTDALALLRHVGMEDVARRAALQFLILDRPT
ncbi:MAG: hypothetical protein GW886_03590 [Rhodobacterales bacterium]|nr:hypothetical protein [Rhodobacterales bacterium]NCT11759.1 hypothetical protein [Rhodobacterales bacterium]